MKPSLSFLVGWDGALEAVVGLTFFLRPELASALLFGEPVQGAGKATGLLLGAALFTYGFTCWNARKAGPVGLHAAGRGLQTYNMLAGFLCAWVAFTPAPHGILALPGLALHLVVWIALTLALRQDIARLKAESTAEGTAGG